MTHCAVQVVPSSRVDAHSARVFAHGDHADALAHVDALGAGVLHQRVVELGAWHHSRVLPVGRERQGDSTARRRDQHRLGDVHVRRQRPHVEPECLECTQRPSRQAVAAGLVAREAGPVDDEHVEPEAAGGDARGDTGRTGAHHEHRTVGGAAGHRSDGTRQSRPGGSGFGSNASRRPRCIARGNVEIGPAGRWSSEAPKWCVGARERTPAARVSRIAVSERKQEGT